MSSEPLLHIDYSSEIEFDVQDENCSSAVLSENEINNNEKMKESPNTMMSRGTDGVQEEQLLCIESLQVSLSEPYEALDGDCDAREPDNISLEHGLEELSNCSVVITSSNKSNNDTKRTECLDLNGVYAMITKPSNATSRPDSTGTPHILRRRSSSIGREELNIGSLKGSNVSKVDGKNLLQRLRRQVRSKRKTLIALYAELDQERNASTVAANEAMAMITQLQQEKAAVQMQALQYQRMEEQADYDQDALQTMSELLIKKEMDISFLEAEMETYREQLQFKAVAEFGEEGWQAIDVLHNLKSGAEPGQSHWKGRYEKESSWGCHC